jgi:glycosyltransferase involved in cell wall biosynthesis
MTARIPETMAAVHASATHLVLIPSYNPGPMVFETVRGALAHWSPVWVVVDGSDDGTPEGLLAMARETPGLRVIVREKNGGKGAAVLAGCEAAAREGFTHVLTMDSDGQHPAVDIPAFMAASMAQPRALILGNPVFDESAPRIRVNGRKLSNLWANVETLGSGIGDSLYGFRIYPIADLVDEMRKQGWMRRFDFDPEAVVRLVWRGLPPVNIPSPVRYLRPDQGGVSHFNYLRDNVLLTWMHARLLAETLVRMPWLLWRKARNARP